MSFVFCLRRIPSFVLEILKRGRDRMKEGKKPREAMPVLRLDPEKRLCPQFDTTGIALFPTAEQGEMGFRVLDNCCEEHEM